MTARRAERDLLESLLLGDRPGTVLLHGASGSGKSTLLGELLARSRQLAIPALLIRATEAGRDVELSGLVDLLGDVPDAVLTELGEPQARALRVALLREAPEQPVDPRALRAAVHGVLTALAATPLLLAVDDVQWVDAATLALLEHAVPRLPPGRVGVLVATRDPETAVRLRDLACAGSSVTELSPAPLTLPETDRLARSLGLRPATGVVREVHRASGGNPMWTVELLQAHQRSGAVGAAPASLEHLVENRVALLPGRHRRLLVAAALAERPDPLLVVRAAALDDAVLAEVTTPALSRVVGLEGGMLRFTHPLLATAVVGLATEDELRATHARLADLEQDEMSRAHHRALANPSDPGSAGELDVAADRALATGRRAVGARLARLALSRTAVTDPHLPARMVRAAESHWALGMPDEALVDLSALDQLAVQPERARLLHARIITEVSGDAATYAFLRADPDLSLRARAEVLAALTALTPVDEPLACDLAAAARDLDARDDAADAPVRAVVAAALADVAVRRDQPDVVALLEDAVAREARLDPQERRAMSALGLDVTPRLSMARHLIALDDFGPARRLLDEVCAEAAPVDDDPLLAAAGLERGHLEVRAGDWARAESEAAAARDRFQLVRSPSGVAMATVQLGAVAALRGQEERAYALLGEAEARGRREGSTFAVATARGNLGRMALGAGRPAEALEHLVVSAEAWATSTMDSPLYNHFLVDRAEAHVGIGDHAAGLAALTEIERLRAPTPRLVSGALRVRALATAASGHLEDAVTLAEEAVAALDCVALPFEAARADLVLGLTLRRLRRKGAADRALARAEEGFASLGAQAWLEKTSRERTRVGLRRSIGLTPTEREVAELAAAGLRNTDIAETLFLATKTVEATLARVYRKLEIRGRAELGRALDARS